MLFYILHKNSPKNFCFFKISHHWMLQHSKLNCANADPTSEFCSNDITVILMIGNLKVQRWNCSNGTAPSKLVKQWYSKNCIQKAPDSNLDQDTGYPDWGLLWLLSVLLGECWESTLKYDTAISKSLPIHHVLIFPSHLSLHRLHLLQLKQCR
jgi:hypothetical protein